LANQTFHEYRFEDGLRVDFTGPNEVFPSALSVWSDGVQRLAAGDTHFCHVFEGSATLSCASGSFTLTAGMFACVPGAGLIEGRGKGWIASRLGYHGVFSLGGPLEEKGRLGYIDGCSDSLLLCPPLLGDPCLNHLHIPPHTHQTRHTHPSLRIGVITAGSGYCHLPEGNVPLTAGTLFCIAAEGPHSFHTEEAAIDVVVYHPDSDFGPPHHNHPMINRTLVEGISAAQLQHLQTKL